MGSEWPSILRAEGSRRFLTNSLSQNRARGCPELLPRVEGFRVRKHVEVSR